MSATGGMLLEEKEEIERQLRDANNAVQGAEAQLRTLLSELGQSAEEMQALLDAIKASPSDFKEDPGRAKKALAEAMLQKMRIEKQFAEQLRTQREAEARSARAVERGTQEATLFAKYVQQASPSEQVKLNVGGEIFTTSKSAMLAADEGSLFEVLYSGRHGTPPSPLFLDRDPALFVYVLRFLRAAGAGQANIGPSTLMIPAECTAAAVLEEARFFGLSQLEGVLLELVIQFRRVKIQNVLENRDGDLSSHTMTVVHEMKTNPDRVGVQEEGCFALECLARAKENQVHFARGGGVDAVADGMKKHPGSAKLQRHGCLALWHVGQNEANKGFRPRIAACYKALGGVAKKVLVEAGINVDARDEEGTTPLITACYNKEEGMARMLVEAGADVNAKNEYGETPLIKECQNKEEGMARMLVEAGADVNATTNGGETALIIACQNNEEGMARMLVEAGADVNAKNNTGETPLIIACSNKEEGMARMLVEAGADVNAKNEYGYTPLEGAKGHTALEQLLRAKGARE